jgi:putative phosphoribosyl transferase
LVSRVIAYLGIQHHLLAMIYEDRRQAGLELAVHLKRFAGRPDVVVLALPRGGVPVASAVAETLGFPMDVFIVRKLGVPGHEEYAMGAIASGGLCVLNDEAIRSLRISSATVEAVAQRENEEIRRRDVLYRGTRPPIDVRDKIIILVDDGLATGSTMRAAVEALRKRSPARIVVAVPVGAVDSCLMLRKIADEVICPSTPEPFDAVGLWYRHFDQTSDAEVRMLLEKSAPQPSVTT